MFVGKQRQYSLYNPPAGSPGTPPTIHTSFCLVEWGDISQLDGSEWDVCGDGTIGLIRDGHFIKMRKSTAPGIVEMDIRDSAGIVTTVSLMIDRHDHHPGWRPWLVGSTFRRPSASAPEQEVLVYVFRLLDDKNPTKRCIYLELFWAEGGYDNEWPPLCSIREGSSNTNTAPKHCDKRKSAAKRSIPRQDEVGTGHER